MVSRIRSVLLGAMTVALAFVAGNVFGEVQWPLVGSIAAVAIVLALVAPARPSIRIPVSVAAWADAVVAAVLWAGGSLSDIFPRIVSGPRRLTTSEWPSPSDPVIIGTLTLLLGVSGFVANELAQRERAHLAPLAPIAAAGTILVTLGAPLPTSAVLVGLIGLLAMVFALTRGDEQPRNQMSSFRADRTVVLIVVAAGATGFVASSVIALSGRADPRRPQEAQSVSTLLDPIEASAALRLADPPIDLFDVADRSALIGRSLPARWRTAALTEYDGQQWVPLVTLRPIGGRLGIREGGNRRAPTITYSVRYRTDDIQAVPFPGRPLEVDRNALTDTDRVVVIPAEAPDSDTVIEAVAEIDPSVIDAQISNFALRQIDDIAVGFTERARTLAGTTTTQFEQLEELEATMRDSWQLDSDAPGAGQQLTLLERFVIDTQRGSREQFVAAYVLLARALGFDARVATGFIIPPEDLGIPLTIRSDHAAAWPEVRLADGGWVAFDPVPDAPTSADLNPPEPPAAQSPAAAQPPILPPSEDDDQPEEQPLEPDAGRSRWSIVVTWATRAGAVTGLTLLPFALVIGTILLIKYQRRRRRRLLLDPDRRVRGEWANTTDYLIDAGLTVRPSWTDERIATEAAQLARRAPFELRRLAALSTAMTFGVFDDANDVVLDALETSRIVDAAIRTEQTRSQRIRTHLSLRSLRKSTRSPVVV